MNSAISVKHFVKSYGSNLVIDDVSFDVQKGEIFGLLGANGAGKTTILECCEGLRKYNSGDIVLSGEIGVQLQSSSLPAHITVKESFSLFCKWNKAEENTELLKAFGLIEIENKQYRSMSTGQKRRLHLALALINNPDILFLDEPTAGLDVEGRVSLHKAIRKLKADGKTIIMASHDMAEIENLCDTIAILKEGKIVFRGTPTELTSAYLGKSKILIKSQEAFKKSDFISSHYLGMQQEYFTVMTDNISEALLELLQYAKDTMNKIEDIKIERATLEQRFIEIATGGNKE